jgi:uncharacterized protein
VIRFLDTSALVQRYLPEPGSERVRAMLRTSVELAVASITVAELCAGIARAHREGRLTRVQRDRIIDRVPTDLELFQVVEPRWRLLLGVAELVRLHPLRAYDAVQLAACLELRRAKAVELWAADGELIRAARAERLKVVAL